MIHFFLENSNSELTTIHIILQTNFIFQRFLGLILVLSEGGARFRNQKSRFKYKKRDMILRIMIGNFLFCTRFSFP